MADTDENDLLAIDVDPDEYASTAAGDVPSFSRTYQSEADFRIQQANYTAKIDGGKSYEDLIAAFPVLSKIDAEPNGDYTTNDEHGKVTLSKKHVQLLGYAAGELYFDGEYEELGELCARVRKQCVIDNKLEESLTRWTRRCRERLGSANGSG